MATTSTAPSSSYENIAAWFNTSNSDAVAWVKDILREPVRRLAYYQITSKRKLEARTANASQLNAVKHLSKHVIWCGVEVAALTACLVMLSLAWAWTKTFRMTSIVLLMTATLLSSCMDLYEQSPPGSRKEEVPHRSVEEKDRGERVETT